MSIQSDELRKYFEQAGILQREVAEKIGVHEGTISSILSGRYGISKRIARLLADAYGFDLEFLLLGTGTLISPPGSKLIHQTQRVSGGSTGFQTISSDRALAMENAQLREQLAQAKEREDRLLGIIDTLTQK